MVQEYAAVPRGAFAVSTRRVRQLMKWFAMSIAWIVSAPWILLVVTGLADFRNVSQMLALIPGSPGILIRRAFYGVTLMHVGQDLVVGFGTVFARRDISIGDRVNLGMFNTLGLVDIGNDVMTSGFVHFLSGNKQHGTSLSSVPFKDQPGQFQRVGVGTNVWIGAASVLMANVGSNTIIGAGSVVTRSIPDGYVAVGNPAQTIRSLTTKGEGH